MLPARVSHVYFAKLKWNGLEAPFYDCADWKYRATFMKTVNDILLLGDPRLYEVCEPVKRDELPLVAEWVADLHSAMEDIRRKYQFGRGIAAPQIGVMKRLFYLNLDKPYVIINPEIHDASEAMFDLWDDCMSFPNLLVKVRRHQSLTLHYLDENWQTQTWRVQDDISELIQHEYDHLNGVLCTMRAIDELSFKWKNENENEKMKMKMKKR